MPDCPMCSGAMSEYDWAYGICPHCGHGFQIREEGDEQLENHRFTDEGWKDDASEDAW